MTDKMTDNEILNALECFKSEDCLGEQCPYFEKEGLCGKPMCRDVYDFIYRQKAEIERLRCSAIRNGKQIESLIHHLEQSKSEAYREFAERLKDQAYINSYCDLVVNEASIDNVYRELIEKNDKG